MAGDELLFHSPSLIKAAKDLRAAAVALDAEWKKMQAAGQALTFGDDIVASLVGLSYQAASEMAHDSYTSAAEKFAEFGDAIGVMSGVYDTTEHGNTQMLDGAY